MKFFLAFVTLAAVVSGALGACDWPTIKGCLTKVTFIANTQLVAPKNDQETQKFCKELDEARQCVNDFGNKCLTLQLSKNVLNEVDKALKSYNNEICSTPAARAQLQKRLVCYAKPETKNQMHILHKKYIALIEKIPTYPKPERLEAFCCSLLLVREAAIEYNTKACGKDVADFIDNHIKKVFGPVFQRECKKKSSKECNLPANVKKDYEAIMASKTAPVTKHENAIPTLIDLIKDLFN